MFGRLDWSRNQMRAAAVAECAGGMLMVSPSSRRLGGVVVVAVSAAVLTSESRHGATKLGLARALVLVAGLAAIAAPQRR